MGDAGVCGNLARRAARALCHDRVLVHAGWLVGGTVLRQEFPGAMIPIDLWRVGIIRAPMTVVMAEGSLAAYEVRWLPLQAPLCFMADPFGLWRDELLYVFVESYDYRVRKGVIEVLVLDADLRLQERRVVLAEPWHLSYPYVFESDGEIWMLPEGYKSGRTTLYRCVEFPWKWVSEPRFSLPEAAIDPALLRTSDGWLLFYTPPGPKPWRTSALKIARADHLLGPWHGCDAPPVMIDRSGARMGGTPIPDGDGIWLPTQDCRDTYGQAIQPRRLVVDKQGARCVASGAELTPPPSWAPYVDGVHTLSPIGSWTLVDAKWMKRSFAPVGYWLQRKLGRHA